MINQGADVYNRYADNGQNAFDMAAELGKLNIVKYIVQNLNPNKAQLNSALYSVANSDNLSGLQYISEATDLTTARKRYLQIVKYLVEAGATPLNYAMIMAVIYGQLNIVKYLISRGADKHYDNDAALLYAELKNHSDIVKYFRGPPGKKGKKRVSYI